MTLLAVLTFLAAVVLLVAIPTVVVVRDVRAARPDPAFGDTDH